MASYMLSGSMSSAPLIRCAVKKFVDLCCRCGDLESYGTAGPTAAEGQKAHKALQLQKKTDETAEVKIECVIKVDSRELHLSGRIDLLRDNPGNPCVSEIKSCHAPPDRLPANTVALHWAQLKVYGYCVLAKNKQLHTDAAGTILLRLVWFNLIANQVTIDEQKFSFAELKTFINEAASRYVSWIELTENQFQRCKKSAAALEFPHNEFRAGQRKMAAASYLSARDGFHVMCEAPTGIGKTISAMFPAIKSVGNGDIDRIIYLTAKNSGRQAAANCLAQLASAGLAVSAITITAKKTTCHCSNGTCERNSDDGSCPLTIGFWDRLPKAREQLIGTGIITPHAIDDAAHEHALCPFELTLQMLPWVQVTICDFNYVFDPLVRLTALTENTSRQLLLVDEAHNLIDRSRSMYSAPLDRNVIKRAVNDLGSTSVEGKNLQALVRAIDRWSKQCKEQESASEEPPKTISRAIKRCMQSMMDDTDQRLVITEAVADAARALFRYAVIEDLYSEQHRSITEKQSNGKYKNTVVTLQCLNADRYLKKSYQQYRSSVTFSATLRPQHFYLESLGLPDDTRALSLQSPFEPSQQSTLVCEWVDTRYKNREHAKGSIVEIIAQVINAQRGNYQVFFPSYVFMESVYEEFARLHPATPVIVQKRASSEAERKAFLDHFTSGNDILAFSILGGVFGEGVDYAGDQLIGSIIVGTGLSSINLTQKLIEQDYAARGLNSFDYASRYPGLTRVLQTAGRVIRTATDKGVVVLVDQRFGQGFYQQLYPEHWQTTVCQTLHRFEQSLNTFWHTDESDNSAVKPILRPPVSDSSEVTSN